MKKIKQNLNQRSISATEKNNKKLSENEKANFVDNNNVLKKGFHHRKRTSSYFLGSYLPDLNCIENNCQNLNNNDFKENIDNNKEMENNIINNRLIYNLINTENLNELSLSFPSYDDKINNSVIVKNENKEKNKSINENNNIILDIAKNSENSSKSFITFKNSLKYLKDKDERTTPSYQLALQADKKGGKNNYLTSSNIIEEEKSSMIESKSEFSNKKDMFGLEKGKEKENIKREPDDCFKNLNINNNWNFYSGNLDNKNEMALALNEIIIKNNKKEEERKNYLSKNKKVLLNTFFTMSNTLKIKGIKNIEDKYSSENNKNKKENENFKIFNDKINNNDEYFLKNRFRKIFFEKPSNYHNQNYSLSENNLGCNNIINNSNKENNIDTESFKKNVSKIPHLYNIRKNQRIMNNSPSNSLINVPYKSLKTSNSNNLSSRNSSQTNKKLSKILAKKDSKSNLHSIKRRENLNNALLFIREKKRNKLNDIDKKKYYSNNTYSISGVKKLTNITYTNSLTNSNLNTNNSNTQSHSKSKEKSQKILRNANSSISGNKIEQIENYTNIESNKDQTVICLKYKLLFNKLYEKIDVLEKVNITGFSAKNFYVILCENKLNLNKFMFSSLFKYYQDKNKFIKIYGDEKNPNYILLKDIIETKKFQIYEDNNNSINSSINTFMLTNRFKFTNNAMIFVKN